MARHIPRLLALLILAAAVQAILADATSAGAAPPSRDAVLRGRAVFEQNCLSCHGVDAAGGFGPALKPFAARKDRRSVEEIVKSPGPNMPPLYPVSLTDANVADVAAFIASLQ